MDLNDFWQENKRLVLSVLGGIALFFTALSLLHNEFYAEAGRRRASIARKQDDLAQPLFGTAELERAREQARALGEAVLDLRGRVAFQARPEFKADGRTGSVSNTYFAVASTVREDLLTLAGRANLRLSSDLGLPAAVVDEDEIVRYLEGLDVVDRVVRLAVQCGVERIDAIRMKLDPALLSGRQLPALERTRVEIDASGASDPLVRLLALLQEPRYGQVLLVEQLEMQTARAKRDEATLKLALVIVRWHAQDPAEMEP